MAMITSLFSGLSVSAADLSYNTGTRHEVCEDLSTQAEAYYTGEYTWDKLSTLPGDSTESSLAAMDSQLFDALHNLMKNSLTNLGSYNGKTNGLQVYWPYTDASEGSAGTHLFYSDEISESFNREHVWPKSRAGFYQSNGGADLHHLRPTASDVNSTRSNYTMGNVRKVLGEGNYQTYKRNGKDVLYYSASYGASDGSLKEGLVEVNDNIKGDVARILLYVYVTWEQPNLFETLSSTQLPPKDQGDDQYVGLKVIADLDTLLDWMKIDPVDTWEMGRNDVIESIQGNRNVFIDYPELAWLLFNQPLPGDYTTPSGYAISQETPAYTITAKSNNDDWGTVALNGSTVIATPAEGYAVSGYTLSPEDAASVTQNGNLFRLSDLKSAVTLTVNFAPKTDATVTYVVPEGVSVDPRTVSTYVGDTIVLPTVTGTPTGHSDYTFVGWVAKPTQDSTDLSALNMTEAGGDYTVPGNVTLYALFSYLEEGGETLSGEYRLVTEAPADWTGEYVFAAQSESKVMSNECSDNTAYMVSYPVDIKGDVIETTNSAFVWKVTRQSDGTYTIQDSQGKYLSAYGTKKVKTVDAADSTTSWKLSVGEVMPNETSYGALQYNAGAPRFTTYTSTQVPVHLFAGSHGTIHYTTLDSSDPCANGHTWGKWEVTTPAACEQPGEETRTCLVCSTSETRPIPALEHVWGEWEVTTPAACEKAGEETRTCSLCSKNETRPIPALEHVWDEGKVTTEPTPEKDGVRTFTCTLCGKTRTEVIPATGNVDTDPAAKYTDVEKDKWYYNAVNYVLTKNLFYGIDDTHFGPDDSTTRGMLVTVLWRLDGRPDAEGENIFVDVGARKYYAQPVLWAAQNGIVSGRDATHFDPNANVSREEVAAFMYRYARYKGYNLDARADLSKFPDASQVSRYAKDNLSWAVAAGLISGVKNGNINYLNPKGNATRAQIAQILIEFEKNIIG